MSNEIFAPTREQLEGITLGELTAYLTRQNVSVKCKECQSNLMSINACDAEGKELSITEDQVTSNINNRVAYQYFTVVCGNCGNTRFFNAIVVYRGVIENRNINNEA